MNLNTSGLFDLSRTLAGEYLARFEYPWQALDGIKELILRLGPALGEEYEELGAGIWVHQTAQIAHSAFWARLHHRPKHRSAPLRLYPGLRPGGGGLRGGQLGGAEKRHPLRQRTGSPLQLRGRLHFGLQEPHGGGVHHLQREVGQNPCGGEK